MSRARIENAAVITGDCHRFACCGIWQAENDNIGRRHELRARGVVFAGAGSDLQQLDVSACAQPVADLESGSSGLSVDEYSGHLGRLDS